MPDKERGRPHAASQTTPAADDTDASGCRGCDEWCLRDALSRLTRAQEAILDGDLRFAGETLEDLANDFWYVVKRAEREAR